MKSVLRAAVAIRLVAPVVAVLFASCLLHAQAKPGPGSCVHLVDRGLELRALPKVQTPWAQVESTVSADPSRTLAAVYIDPGFLGGVHVGGAFIVGLAGPNTLCYGAWHNLGFGIRVDSNVVREWNAIISHAAPDLDLATPDAALGVAKLALTMSTGALVDTNVDLRDVQIHLRNGSWSVSGSVFFWGRRAFAVQLKRHGRLESFSLQDPEEPCVSGQRRTCVLAP